MGYRGWLLPARWSWILAIAFLPACAQLDYRPPMDTSAQPSRQKAYVYGQFKLDRDSMNFVRLAIQIESREKGGLLSLRLLDDRPLYAVEIDPGIYELRGLVYAPVGAMLDAETRRIALPSDPAYLRNPIVAEAGKAYYLGDFHGVSRRSQFLVTPVFVFAGFKGGLVGVASNFAGTTELLKASTPALRDLEFVRAWKEMN